MVVYYRSDGEILYAVYERDRFSFAHTTQIPLTLLEIDEVAANQPLCRDLFNAQGRRDAAGQGKYYLVQGELFERDAWREKVVR